MFQKNQTLNSQTPQTAGTPQSPVSLTPQAVVDQLRAIRSQISDVKPLTADQRRTLQRLYKSMSNEVLQASLNVIGTSEIVQQSVGQAEDARELHEESNRWTVVEDELRSMLNVVAGANVIRRQRVALIASRAYGIGNQLARDPEHESLKPQLDEIKRLKALNARGKKKAPQTPSTTPQPVPAPSSSSPTQKL